MAGGDDRWDRTGQPGPVGEGADRGRPGEPHDDVGDDDVVDAEVVAEGSWGEPDRSGQPTSAEGAGPFGKGDPLTVALDERDEYLDALRRLQAEFENYRKRVSKQQAEQTARAALSLVDKLLPVLDTLDLAAEHLGDAESTDAKALVAASSLLHGVLAKEGLERVDPIGEPFDPNAHEAVGHLPAEEDPAGSGNGPEVHADPVVAQVMRPGYRWNGAVVRPAMVVVRG